MPYNRPTLPTLIERIVADIESRVAGADARLRRSNFNVLARVLAAVAHGLYGFLGWVFKQLMPDTADAEMLDRHASIWLANGRKAASYATGHITVSGTNGTTVPAGTVFKRADGISYSTLADGTVAGGSAVIEVVSDLAGQAVNADAGTALTIDSPIVGINAAATASTALSGGADVESDDALRERLLARIQQTPRGGARHDYVTWALEVPGVTRAWCYPLEQGDGTVTVRFMRDDDATAIPDAGEVATVQAYIEPLIPVGSQLYVVAPVAAPIAFHIQVTPATAAVKAAVEASLRDLLRNDAEPEGGGGEGRIPVSHLREAISLAAGETDHVLVAPTADVTPSGGQIATFGSITWVP